MPINHKIILPLLLSLAILLIPTHWIPLEGITVVEQRVVAIFVLAALCWILEPIPIFATSVLIIVLELLLLSDKGIWFMTADKAEPGFGELLKSTEVMATFASPVIMLFLGGFSSPLRRPNTIWTSIWRGCCCARSVRIPGSSCWG